MKINKTLLCSLCMLVSSTAFAADNTDAVMMDASPCLGIVSPIERLACFEEQANTAQRPGTPVPQQNLPVLSLPRNTTQQPVQAPAQAKPQPVSETPQAVESARIPPPDSFEDNFGLPEEKFNEGKEKAPANELIARVAELKELNRNRFIITLDNGQIWEQMETRRFALAEGDEVRIYSTRWGSSFRLSSQSLKGYIQVRRLQ